MKIQFFLIFLYLGLSVCSSILFVSPDSNEISNCDKVPCYIYNAINNAADGDTLLLAPGVYEMNETLISLTKGLYIINNSTEEVRLTGIVCFKFDNAGSSVKFENISISNVSCSEEIINSVNLASLTLRNVSFNRNDFLDLNENMRDVLSIGTGTSITISHCIFSNGGGIRLHDFSDAEITHTIFRNNSHITESGGGILATDGTNIILSDCVFEDNQVNPTKDGGGASFADMGAITLLRSKFVRNYGGCCGGGVYNTRHTNSMYVEDCEFQANYVKDGGGIYISGAGGTSETTEIHRTKFLDHYIEESGGGVLYRAIPSILFNECVFDNNFVGYPNNPWQAGGAIFGLDCPLEIRNSVVMNTTSTSHGGGFYLEEGVLMDNCSMINIKNIDAGRLGGAIYSDLDGSVSRITNSIFRNCSAPRSGGALYFLDSSQVNVSGSFFIDNNCEEQHGGGMYLENVESVFLNDTTFQGNNAVRNGGGIYLITCEEVSIYGSSFISNHVVGSGGGIFLYNSSHVNVDGSSFIDNNAVGNGGGISLFYSSKRHFEDVVFHGNIAIENGGGMFTKSSGDLVLLNSVFEDNSAFSGAGIYSGSDGQRTFEGVRFNGNIANDTGGGLFSSYGGQANVNNCNFSRNSASESIGGSAIYSVGNVIDLSHSRVSYHSDTRAKVYLRNTFSTITSCIFEHNTASHHVTGCVALYYYLSNPYEDGSLLLSRSIFRNNSFLDTTESFFKTQQSTALKVLFLPDFTVDNCLFENNKNGRAIYPMLMTNHTTIIKNTVFRGNEGSYGSCLGTRISTLFLTNCSFYENDGINGALYIWNSIITITSSYFERNTGTNGACITLFGNNNCSELAVEDHCVTEYHPDGETIGITECGGVYIFRSTFIQNSADYGSAIFSSYVQEDKEIGNLVSIYDCNFTSNHANEGGGAIFSEGYSQIKLFEKKETDHFWYGIGVTLNYYVTDTTSFPGFNISFCSFHNNSAQFGGSILSRDNSNLILIEDSTFSKSIADTGSELFFYNNQVRLIRNKFLGGSHSRLQRGAVYCQNCEMSAKYLDFQCQPSITGGCLFLHANKKVEVEDSEFVGCQDGSITFFESQSLDSEGLEVNLVKDCVIKNGSSLDGPALRIDSSLSPVKVMDTLFKYNVASRVGGAAYFSQCGKQLLFDGDVSFIQNYGRFGGALGVQETSVGLIGSSNVIMNLNDGVVGTSVYDLSGDQDTIDHILENVNIDGFELNTPAIRSKPYQINLLRWWTDGNNKLFSISPTDPLRVYSGEYFNLEIEILDMNGNVLVDFPFNDFQIRVSSPSEDIGSLTGSVLSRGHDGTPKIHFSSLKFEKLVTNSESTSFEISISSTFSSIPISLTIEGEIQECEIGEVLVSFGQYEVCRSCPSGYYQLIKSFSRKCWKCHRFADCEGTKVKIKKGYWAYLEDDGQIEVLYCVKNCKGTNDFAQLLTEDHVEERRSLEQEQEDDDENIKPGGDCENGFDPNSPMCSECEYGSSEWNGVCMECSDFNFWGMTVYGIYTFFIVIVFHINSQNAVSGIEKISSFFGQTYADILANINVLNFMKPFLDVIFKFKIIAISERVDNQWYDVGINWVARNVVKCPFQRTGYLRIVYGLFEPVFILIVLSMFFSLCFFFCSRWLCFVFCCWCCRIKKKKKKNDVDDDEEKEDKDNLEEEEAVIVEETDLKKYDSTEDEELEELKEEENSSEEEEENSSEEEEGGGESCDDNIMITETEGEEGKFFDGEKYVSDETEVKKSSSRLQTIISYFTTFIYCCCCCCLTTAILKHLKKTYYKPFTTTTAYYLTFLNIIIVSYQIYVEGFFNFLNCAKVGDEWVIKSSGSVKCYDSTYWFVLIGFSILGLFLVSIPFSIILFLVCCNKNLDRKGFSKIFGSLYTSYQQKVRVWYESFAMSRRFVLGFLRTAGVIIFGSGISEFLVVCVLFIYLIIHVQFRPYLLLRENIMEFMSISTLILLQIAASTGLLDDDEMNDQKTYTFGIVLLSATFIPTFLVITYFRLRETLPFYSSFEKIVVKSCMFCWCWTCMIPYYLLKKKNEEDEVDDSDSDTDSDSDDEETPKNEDLTNNSVEHVEEEIKQQQKENEGKNDIIITRSSEENNGTDESESDDDNNVDEDVILETQEEEDGVIIEENSNNESPIVEEVLGFVENDEKQKESDSEHSSSDDKELDEEV